MNTFYSETELSTIGLKSYGKNVLVSRNAIFYCPEEVSLGNDVRIDDFSTISGKVIVGNNVHIAQFCGLYGGDEGIYMEDFSGLSSKSIIYATSDDYSGESMTNPMVPEEYRRSEINKKVIIGKHVVIGCMSVVLPGASIEEGSSVGAMSLVNKPLTSWGVYAGIPVKRIKDRSKRLLDFEADYINMKSQTQKEK